MALKVANTHVGPLATSYQALLNPLKETLLALLNPNEASLTNGLPLSTLANSFQVAIGRKMGIEEPQLMRIMRATLHTHNEWFELQMCKDRFEEMLKIDLLSEVGGPFKIDSINEAHGDNSTLGSSHSTICSNSILDDVSSPSQVSSTESKVMEFLALPRADAITLLMQNNGNVETVIQQIFF